MCVDVAIIMHKYAYMYVYDIDISVVIGYMYVYQGPCMEQSSCEDLIRYHKTSMLRKEEFKDNASDMYVFNTVCMRGQVTVLIHANDSY